MLFPCDFIFISPFLGCGWSISLRQDNACNGFPETDPQFRSPEWVRRAPPESQSCDIASGLNFLHVCRLDAAPLPNPFTHVAQNCHGIHACQNPVYSCPFQTITILVPTLQWQLAKTELLLIKMNKIKCIIKIATWLDLWLETCAQCIDWHDIWAQHFTTKGKMQLVHKTKDGLLNHFQSLTTTLTKVWHGFCRSPLTKRIIYCILAGGKNSSNEFDEIPPLQFCPVILGERWCSCQTAESHSKFCLCFGRNVEVNMEVTQFTGKESTAIVEVGC